MALLQRRKRRIVDRRQRMFARDAVLAFHVSRQQGLVGENVNATRQAFRNLRDQFDRIAIKQVWPLVAGLPQAKHQILADIRMHQGFQPETMGHAFTQRAHARGEQVLVEFLLAKQCNLQQFVPV